jgi:hypothetical protein
MIFPPLQGQGHRFPGTVLPTPPCAWAATAWVHSVHCTPAQLGRRVHTGVITLVLLQVSLPGGADRWHPICIAAGGRHSMCMALPRQTVTDHERRLTLASSGDSGSWPVRFARVVNSSPTHARSAPRPNLEEGAPARLSSRAAGGLVSTTRSAWLLTGCDMLRFCNCSVHMYRHGRQEVTKRHWDGSVAVGG